MQPFLALITPVGDAGPPLGIWGGRPPNYVDIGGPGPQPYPGQGLPGNQPYPGQGLPGPQPYPDQSLPGQQPRPWGPVFYPDQGLPQTPGRPSHPIYYPPVIWDPNFPTNPIANPGDPNNPEGPKIEWKTAWSPSTGWIVVGIPTGPTPTPSDEG